MKDLKNIAIEIAAISAGGPTNWALLSEDASTKELKIVNKGSNGLPELRKALTSVKANMASGAAAPSPSLVGYVNYNNVPLKLRLMDSKPSRALAKHHDVKVLLKNHVAVLDVENVDSDLKEEAVERAIEAVSPASSPTRSVAEEQDEEEAELQLNRAFEAEMEALGRIKAGARERLGRLTLEVEKEQRDTLAAQLRVRESVEGWMGRLKGSGAVLFEGWVSMRGSESEGWKARWAVIESHKLTVFRDELKKAAVVSWNLSGAKVNYPTSDECDLRNSFEISSLPSGTTFYADCPDALHRLTAAIELSAL